MKTSVVVFSLSFFWLSVAEVQQLDQRGEEANNTLSPSIKSACSCAHDILFVILRKLEAKLQNTEKQLDDLRAAVQGKNMH